MPDKLKVINDIGTIIFCAFSESMNEYFESMILAAPPNDRPSYVNYKNLRVDPLYPIFEHSISFLHYYEIENIYYCKEAGEKLAKYIIERCKMIGTKKILNFTLPFSHIASYSKVFTDNNLSIRLNVFYDFETNTDIVRIDSNSYTENYQDYEDPGFVIVQQRRRKLKMTYLRYKIK